MVREGGVEGEEAGNGGARSAAGEGVAVGEVGRWWRGCACVRCADSVCKSDARVAFLLWARHAARVAAATSTPLRHPDARQAERHPTERIFGGGEHPDGPADGRWPAVAARPPTDRRGKRVNRGGCPGGGWARSPARARSSMGDASRPQPPPTAIGRRRFGGDKSSTHSRRMFCS